MKIEIEIYSNANYVSNFLVLTYHCLIVPLCLKCSLHVGLLSVAYKPYFFFRVDIA